MVKFDRTKEEFYRDSVIGHKRTIDVLYHKWGVGLYKNAQYKIPQDDLETLAWAKKKLDKSVKDYNEHRSKIGK